MSGNIIALWVGLGFFSAMLMLLTDIWTKKEKVFTVDLLLLCIFFTILMPISVYLLLVDIWGFLNKGGRLLNFPLITLHKETNTQENKNDSPRNSKYDG